MMPELVKRKTTRLFGLVDANIDGAIEYDDIEKICFNVAKAAGAEPGTAQYSTIQQWYEGAWDVVASLDNDGDGKVDLNEWLEAVERVVTSDDVYDMVIGPMGEQLFDLFDADGDGEITADEFALWLMANNVPEAVCKEAFKHLDLNDDNQITKDEWVILVEQFFTSNDPKSPGNWLFGGPI